MFNESLKLASVCISFVFVSQLCKKIIKPNKAFAFLDIDSIQPMLIYLVIPERPFKFSLVSVHTNVATYNNNIYFLKNDYCCVKC